MPVLKGGNIPQSESASGITIGDKTLEEIVAEEEAREEAEAITPDPVTPYRNPVIRYLEKKQPDGVGRVWTRREINKATWEKLLMSAPTLDHAIISVLLSGTEVSGSQIKEYVMKNNAGITPKQYDIRCSYLMNQTDLGKIVERRREGKGMAYKLVTAALDCKPEELVVFVRKSPKPREAVLLHHKALRPYFELDETVKGKIHPKTEKPDTGDLSKATKGITAAIENALTDILGVNIAIGGRIEIVFKFGD